MEVMLRYVLHFPFRSLFQTRQRRGEGRGRFRRDTTRFTEVFRFVRSSLETPNLRGLKVPRVTTVIFLLSYFEVSCLWLLARSWSCLFVGVLIHFRLFFCFFVGYVLCFLFFIFFHSLLRCSVCFFCWLRSSVFFFFFSFFYVVLFIFSSAFILFFFHFFVVLFNFICYSLVPFSINFTSLPLSFSFSFRVSEKPTWHLSSQTNLDLNVHTDKSYNRLIQWKTGMKGLARKTRLKKWPNERIPNNL